MERRVAGGVMLVALIAGLATIDTYPVGALHDDAVYVILAKALASGAGYHYVNLPGSPAAIYFPPGYPAFLSLLWRIVPAFPANVLLFKLANAVLLSVAAMLMHRLLRGGFGFGRVESSIAAVAAVVSIPMLILTALVMSEPLFLVCVVMTLWAAEQPGNDVTDTRALAIGLLAGAATLVRTQGVALVAAVALGLLFRRRTRAALACVVGAAALVLPWMLWQRAHASEIPLPLQGAYGSYGAWVESGYTTTGVGVLGRTLWSTTAQAVDVIRGAFAFGRTPGVGAVLSTAVLALVVIGATWMWRHVRATLLFIVFSMALVLIWPVPPARYIWGLWPVLMLVPLVGARELLRWRPSISYRTGWRIAARAVVVAPAAAYVLAVFIGVRNHHWDALPRAGGEMLGPIVRTIRGNAKPGEVLAAPAEAAVYLYTGHVTVPVYSYRPGQFDRPSSSSESVEALRLILSSYPVDVLFATGGVDSAAAALRWNGRAMTVRAKAGDATLYDLDAGASLQ